MDEKQAECTCLTNRLKLCEAKVHKCNCPHDYYWPSNGHNDYCPRSNNFVGREHQKYPVEYIWYPHPT